MKGSMKNIVAVAVGCLLSLLILEIFLRIYNPFGFRVKGNKIILRANISYDIKNNKITGVDSIICHKKNKLGFRGANPPQDLNNYLTIITVGGSTTECFYLSEGKTWPDLLAKKLSSQFSKFWLNNAGLDGQSTYGHIILMEDYIIKLKPKVVIFLVGVNEIGRDDLFDYDQRFLQSKNHYQNIKDFFITVSGHSEVGSILVNFSRYLKARTLGVQHASLNLKEMATIDNIDQDIQENTKKLHRERYLKPYEARLTKLIKLCKENNIVPIVITQPALFGDVHDDITNVSLSKIRFDNNINGKLQWEIYELYNDVTREVGKEQNILVIDLAKKMPKSSKYFYDFYHYTNDGAKKMAGIIFEDLYPFLAGKFPQYK